MKPLIIVSTRTGNTGMLAHAIAAAYDVACCEVAVAPTDLTDFNPIVIGYWCDRGMVPDDLLQWMPCVRGKTLGVFATMGSAPSSERAQDCFKKMNQSLLQAGKDNTIEAAFLCQGRIDRSVFDRMSQILGGVTPERQALFDAALTHPDRDDCDQAVCAFRALLTPEVVSQ